MLQVQKVLFIKLGCSGLIAEDNFCICKGIENKIYTLYSDFPYFEDVMNFLDACKLFDRAMFDFNTIRGFLLRFKEKFELPSSPIWIERKFNRYHKFLIDHKECGLILKLELANKLA